jgi:hypothetical protein
MADEKGLSPYAMFSSNAAKETAGIWKQIGATSYLIARAGGKNEKFMKIAKERFLPFQAAINNDMLPMDVARQLAIEAFVDGILLDWKKFYDRDGTELPYSRDNAIRVLTELPELFTLLSKEAASLSNFQGEQLDEAAKN